MFLKDNNPDRNAKAAARQLDKICAKMEQLCVPVQDALMRIAGGLDSPEARQRIEQFQEKLSIVNGALFVLNERQCAPGGGMSQRLAARIASKGPAPNNSPARDDAAADEARPSLQGSCSSLSLAALLQLLAEQKKSGSVTLGLAQETITLMIEDGDVVYVSCSPSRRGERLGELLVANGDVVRDHLIAFVDSYRSKGEHFGMALVERGVVSQEALTRALMQQVQQRLDRAFAEPNCSFVFHEGRHGNPTGLTVDVADFLETTGRAPAPRKSDADLAPSFGNGEADAPPPSIAASKWQGGLDSGWGWKEDK
ncbi:MAG: DUF4388 domain-containing protein [Planctomycetes bacterium]|nr:DUF4388 domain-containing protein [Planctomycetota bacterium]MCB9886422.1 DUF4388 domain-containing protein [Planctomycetota bacterium]